MNADKSRRVTPSERELDILKVLWTLGEAPVRIVHEALCPNGECAFTTVQTLLRIMAEKGLVKQRIEGRTLFYSHNYTSEQASSRFLHKVFDGAVDGRGSHTGPAKTVYGLCQCA